MATQTIVDLGLKVKAKYPGAYDDIPDDELGRKVKAKYPGAYDDFVDAPPASPATDFGTGPLVRPFDVGPKLPPPPPPPPAVSITREIPRGNPTAFDLPPKPLQIAPRFQPQGTIGKMPPITGPADFNAPNAPPPQPPGPQQKVAPAMTPQLQPPPMLARNPLTPGPTTAEQTAKRNQPPPMLARTPQESPAMQQFSTRVPVPPPAPTLTAGEPPSFLESIARPFIGSPDTGDTAIGRALGYQFEGPQDPHVENADLPLINLRGAGPSNPQSVGEGIARGAGEFATGLMTPGNLLVMAGTQGLGALAAPFAKASQIVPRAISAYFTVDMLKGLYEQIPEVKQAVDSGDPGRIAQSFTQAAGTALFAGLAAKHAASGSGITPVADLAVIDQAARLRENRKQPLSKVLSENEGPNSPSDTQPLDTAPLDAPPQQAPAPPPPMNRDQRRATVIPQEQPVSESWDIANRGDEGKTPVNLKVYVAALDIAQSQPSFGRKMLMDRLGVSNAAADRLLVRMEEDGVVKRSKNGNGRDVFHWKRDAAPSPQAEPQAAPDLSINVTNAEPTMDVAPAPTAETQTTPEAPETLDIQFQQLREGKRSVVMVPKGTELASDAVPPGFRKAIIKGVGRFYYDPKVTSEPNIYRAAKDNRLNEILGAKDGGMGAPDKSQLQEPVSAVVARSPEGTEVQSTVADEQNIPNAVAQAEKVMPPGGNVEVMRPEEVIADREDALPLPQGEAPKEGQVYRVNPHEIIADPERFQFKSDAIGKGGTTDKLRDVTEWNPRVAGELSVWVDPKDGKTYVINGHHRLELAQRLNVPEISIQYIDAPDAITARGIGALDNLMEGNGSAVDAAKVFRDLDLSDEDLQARGVALKGPLAREAMGLRDLAPEVFNPVTRGEFDSKNAAMIGRLLKNHADQIAAAKLVEKAEAAGKSLKPAEVERLIRIAGGAERGVQKEATLFGDWEKEHNYAGDQAQLTEWVAQQIRKEKRLFAAVGNQGAAERLGRKGNVIKAEDNAAVAEQASQAAEIFEKLYDRGGPVNDVLRAGATRIAEGENGNAVRKEVYEAVHRAISDIFGGKLPGQASTPEALAHNEGKDSSGLDRSELSGDSGEPTPPTRAELEAAGQEGLFGPSSEEDSGRPVSRSRQANEAGFLSLRGRNRPQPTPKTPAEKYFDDNVQKREAARNSGRKRPVERLTAAIRKLKAGIVDRTSPITDQLYRAQEEHRYTVLPENNVDYQIDRVLRSSPIARQFIEDRGLESIIRNVEDVDRLGEYLIARNAQAVEKRGITTGRDLQQDAQAIAAFDNRPVYDVPPGMPKIEPAGTVKVVDGREYISDGQKWKAPTYKQIANTIRDYNNGILDYSVESGLISKEFAEKLKEIYPDYVPFKRIFSAEELESGAWSSPSVASLSAQSIIRKLGGSERMIENPLASMVMKTFDVFAQGERNKAGRMLAKYRRLPGWTGLIEEVAPGEKVDSRKTFSYLDNGKKRTFKTTEEIAGAAKALDVEQMNWLIRGAAVFTRMLKAGAVGVNIPFMASNVAADIIGTTVTSGGKSVRPDVMARAAKEAITRDSLFKEMRREGTGFTSFDQLRENPREGIDEIRAGRSLSDRTKYAARNPGKAIGSAFRAFEDVVGRSEEFARARLYISGFEKAKADYTKATGKDWKALSPEQQALIEKRARVTATHEANFKLPNYLRHGNWMKNLNALIPFLNARVQGSRSLLRAGEQNPAATAFRLSLYAFLPAAMMTAWNLGDEERKAAFDDVAEYEKRGNIIFIPPNPTKDDKGNYEVVKVKVPPDLGRLVHPIQRVMEQWAGLHPVEFKEVAQDLIGSVSPISPDASMLSEAMPTVFRAPAQSVANFDYFRNRQIVPDTLDRLVPEDQVQPWTSGTARKIGKTLNASPMKVEQFIKDSLAGVGSQLLWASDKALAATGQIPESQVGGQDPVTGTEARFTKARGGEVDTRIRKSSEQLREQVVRAFRAGQPVGKLIGDGIKSRVITAEQARAMIRDAAATPEVRQERRKISDLKKQARSK